MSPFYEKLYNLLKSEINENFETHASSPDKTAYFMLNEEHAQVFKIRIGYKKYLTPNDIEKNNQQLIKLMNYLISDKNSGDYVYDFENGGTLLTDLKRKIIKSLDATPEELLNVYHKMYQTSHTHTFLYSASNKEVLKTFFALGHIYIDDDKAVLKYFNALNNFQGNILSKIEKNQASVNDSLTKDEIKEIINLHLEHSKHVKEINIGYLIEAIDKILPNESEFLEKMLIKYKGYEKEDLRKKENHIQAFNISIPQTITKYNLGNMENLQILMEKINDLLQPLYPAMKVQDITNTQIFKKETTFYRVFVESDNHQPIRLEFISEIYQTVFELYRNVNQGKYNSDFNNHLDNNPQVIEKLVLQQSLNEYLIAKPESKAFKI